MNASIVILVVVVAVVAWLMWSRRQRSDRVDAVPAALPAGAGSAVPAPSTAAAAMPGSYDEYRRLSPSNMVYGKLTCNRCGSNLIAASGGVASCSNCGAALYRA